MRLHERLLILSHENKRQGTIKIKGKEWRRFYDGPGNQVSLFGNTWRFTEF